MSVTYDASIETLNRCQNDMCSSSPISDTNLILTIANTIPLLQCLLYQLALLLWLEKPAESNAMEVDEDLDKKNTVSAAWWLLNGLLVTVRLVSAHSKVELAQFWLILSRSATGWHQNDLQTVHSCTRAPLLFVPLSLAGTVCVHRTAIGGTPCVREGWPRNRGSASRHGPPNESIPHAATSKRISGPRQHPDRMNASHTAPGASVAVFYHLRKKDARPEQTSL